MNEEKVVRRGEVWWVAAEGSSDWEMNFGRPAVVISGNVGNEKSDWVIVAFISSQKRPPAAIFPNVMFPEGTRRVLCNQIYTVKKDRLDRKICELTESEMVRVGGALAVAMCIPQYSKPQPKPEEPVDVVALRCERDMWQKMYETVLGQLVDMQVAADVVRKTTVVEKPPVVEPKPPKKKEKLSVVKEEPLLVDINHCSELALRELGLSDADVVSVISCRPFESVLELNCVPDLDTGWVAANEHRFVCTPVVAEGTKKVNINTCMPRDLVAIGVNINTARRITSHRKRNGKFGAREDVMNVTGVGQKWLDQWIDKLEV